MARRRICPDCGNEYSGIVHHWRGSNCQEPKYSDKQIKIIEALLLGDGTIYKRDGCTALFQIGSSEKEFLNHLQEKFGVLAGRVTLSETAEQIAERNSSDSVDCCQDHYKLRLVANEQINTLYEKWYDGGEKSIPEGITLSDEMFRYWYACDGSLRNKKNTRPTAGISNVSLNDATVERLMRNVGELTDTSGSWYVFTTESGQKILNRTKPLPGYEYKWNR